MTRRHQPHLALFIVLFGLSSGFLVAQTDPGDGHTPSKTPPKDRISSKQSITVEAHLSPEEKEDGDLNEVYQPVYASQKQDCKGAIEKYRTEVIPRAEHAKFNIPKNKFLYLSYRGIGDCNMRLKNYAEAEAIYQKLFDYLPVWPGNDDSDYPINFRSLGLARMAQEKWTEAQESLEKSVTIFDDLISRVSKSDTDFVSTQMANDYRVSQDSAMNLLAVVYFREKRNSEALQLLERAYKQATDFHAPAPIVKQIVDTGVSISIDSVNVSAGLTWSKRALNGN